jgi:hypothetical protein
MLLVFRSYVLLSFVALAVTVLAAIAGCHYCSCAVVFVGTTVDIAQ